ncbi:KAP family NTPase [Streptomyces sp. NBC_00988]|uniref:KAP family P-loop NTPase fold protein n=1 Tax=Streptomyces sp. NBC_00988 TaxID=2903704 RepID=UPI003870138A|nr:KAP family NTPase [Streptomyces sp. NBC_00988]
MRILAQPARRSDRTVERHYQDTIVRPVAFGRYAELLEPATLGALQRLFPGGSAQMWGVMPGRNEANLPEIRKMTPGSWVFFSGDKRLYLGGTVALAWRSPELAARLWGTDSDTDGTWEYMYALTGTRDFDIPIEEIRDLLGWKQTRNIMRFQAFTQAEADLLQQHYGLEPSPLDGPASAGSPFLPGLHSDTAGFEDLLGNEADVDMLAKLAAARSTALPLAIALLGEWGAGKSSFIQQMSRRIEELAALSAHTPHSPGAFTTSVRQIHFNAWHYSDEHVWSGLVDHLFRALAPAPDLQATATGTAVAEREQCAAELVRLESEQQQLDTELERTAQARPRGVLSFAGSPLEGVRLLCTAGRLALGDVRHGRLVIAGWVLLLGGVYAAHPWLASWLGVLLGVLGSVATPALPLWMVLRRRHEQGISFTGRVRAFLEERSRTVREEVTIARARLAEIDAAVRLAQFLTQRSAPDSYRQYRGLLGTVHDDLSQLDEKLREAHAEWARSASDQPPPLERIILYIDDLDRCSPPRVVEVLAAVHLMLALPLFVVVVAVDPRWLLRSLEHHYRELFTDTAPTPPLPGAPDTATPLDYLDKIFQIPFVVPPATPEKTARLITALLETPDVPHAPGSPGGPGIEPGGTAAAATEPAVPATPGDVAAPVQTAAEEDGAGGSNPVQLQLQPAEIAFMARVSALTRTPRAAKKLVNLYRLARIGVPGSHLPAFVGSEQVPGEHQVVQILLALLVGSPRHAADVFRAVVQAPPNTKITEVLRGAPAGVAAAHQVADLIEQADAETPVLMDTAVYQQWCPRLARFSFYTRDLTG